MSEHRRRSSQPPRPEGRGSSHRAGDAPEPRDASASSDGGRRASGAAAAPRPASRAEGSGRGRGRAASGSGGRGPGKRRRFIDYPRSGKRGVRRWLPSFRQILALFLFFLASLVGLVGLAYALVPVPNPNAAMQIQSNIYYYSDGVTEIGRSGQVNRQNVGLDQVPKDVQHAVIAAENRSFYSDSGISPKGLTRAVLKMATGGDTQGGSTITQQFVKNYYLTQEQSVTRKFKEMFIAIKVDRQMSKDQILEGYLNTSFYGRNAYGIQAAAQAYYNKDAKDLNVSEGAYLATLLNAPGIYDVSAFPGNLDRVKGRWEYTLDGMVKSGWLSKEDRAKQQFEMPIKPKPVTNKKGQAGYLMSVVDNYLKANDIVSAAELARGGYKIVTTFDKNKQQAAVDAVDHELTSTLKPDQRTSDKYVRTGIASVVPGDGAVVALYGGPDFIKQEYNDATRQDIQVGSTFKAFVLAAALRDGSVKTGKPISPDSIYNGDNHITVKMPDGRDFTDNEGLYHVTNENDRNRGPISIRTAMDTSTNSVFAQLAADVGFDKVTKAAEDAGLPATVPDIDLKGPSLALGVATPSALDMADAYATFAARGKHADPYFIKEVKHNNEPVSLPAHKTKQVFDPKVADMVTDVLKGVIWNPDGTARVAQALDRPAAGKTGTTDQNRSAWFVGYTPDLATSVGLFRQDPEDPRQQMLTLEGLGGEEKVHGGAVPTEIWTNFMKKALEGTPPSDFAKPDDDLGEQQDRVAPSTAPPTTAPPSAPPPSTAPPSTETATQPPTLPSTGDSSSSGWPPGLPPGSRSPSAPETGPEAPSSGTVTRDPGGGGTGAGGGTGNGNGNGHGGGGGLFNFGGAPPSTAAS